MPNQYTKAPPGEIQNKTCQCHEIIILHTHDMYWNMCVTINKILHYNKVNVIKSDIKLIKTDTNMR